MYYGGFRCSCWSRRFASARGTRCASATLLSAASRRAPVAPRARVVPAASTPSAQPARFARFAISPRRREPLAPSRDPPASKDARGRLATRRRSSDSEEPAFLPARRGRRDCPPQASLSRNDNSGRRAAVRISSPQSCDHCCSWPFSGREASQILGSCLSWAPEPQLRRPGSKSQTNHASFRAKSAKRPEFFHAATSHP